MATAALTGTVTTAPFRGANIVAGGKTLILTLTGDTYVATGATFDAQRQNIINGMTSAGAEANGWNVEVKGKIAVTDVVRTSNTVCTITLDAEALFSISATEVVTITIPASALTAATPIVVTPTLLVIPSPFTFYIRKIGSDSNDGTTAATAWLTFGKALGAAGVSSGDQLWVGAGVYREIVTVNMTSATVETKIYGDVTGSNTGDPGEVQWTAYLVGDVGTPSATALLNLNGKSFLTFQDLVLVGGSTTTINSLVNTSTDIKLTRCLFQAAHTGNFAGVNITSAANVALNWVVDSCDFRHAANCFIITPVRPATADFNLNVIIKNCKFMSGPNTAIPCLAPTGANTFNPGGVNVYNCTLISGGSFLTTGSNWSTTIPCNVYNCWIWSSAQGVVATTSGQIVEDWNILTSGTTPRTNVTAGTHSISNGSYAPLAYTGHEYFSVGSNLMPFGMPKPGSPLLGFGNQAATVTTDILGITRPSGFVKVATGTATSGAAKTITLSTAAYGTNAFAGMTIKIISGTGSAQPPKTISANTATVITVDGNWITQPDNTSVFEVYLRATASGGTFTAGSTTTGTDSNAAWAVNMWAGYTIHTDSGTGSGQTLIVVSNTATVLTWAAATAVDNTTTYSLFKGTNVNTINAGVGCYENGQSAIKETTTIRTGSNALRIPGAGYIDFVIPVNAVSTTITIYAQYDSAYSGTLPSMNIVNGTECGVANATATCVGAANSFEQLSLNFTPTAAGIITMRLLSSSTTPTGNSFWDDYNIV